MAGEVNYTETNSDGLIKLTSDGREALQPWVTSLDDNVYAFTGEADALMVAAGEARLSRNSNDLRAVIANEFLATAGKDEQLLRRVVTQFGDDSVMQLFPLQMAFEGVSNIATKEIEWGRLAAYLEQSTRYIEFNKLKDNGEYRYFTPEEFDEETTTIYKVAMDKLFELYSELYEKVFAHRLEVSDEPEESRDNAWRQSIKAKALDDVRAVLPASTESTVGMQGSSQAIYNMILHMNAHELPEIRTLGHKALSAVRMVAPVFFERIDNPEQGGLISDHKRVTREETKALAAEIFEENRDYLDKSHNSPESQPGTVVRLVSADGDEDELVAKILTDSTTESYVIVRNMVAFMSDKTKQKVIETYVGDRYNRRAKPGRAFELPHYLFEIVCTYGEFRDIQRHRMVDGLDWQQLQTGLGHSRPEMIDQAGVADLYEEAFATSEKLYDELKQRGYTDQAQYATLFGHNMRFTMKVNARALMQSAELRTTPQGHPGYRRVYQQMVQAVAERHPNIAKAMSFLNQSEDPELSRLGAERNTQRKLADLDNQE